MEKIKSLVMKHGIEKFLIINGYITEEYKDYITLFSPGNITKDENSFVFAVKNGEILPFDYKLDNVDNVLKRLKESDFDKVSILNFKLLDCLIDNNDVEKQLRIVKLLDNPNYDSLQFIDEFVNSYKSSSKYFINVLVENSKELWKKVYKRLGNDDYITKWVKTFLMNKKSLGNVDYNFFEYVATHKNIDKYINDDEIDTITDSLIDLEIKFENIAKVSNTNFLKRVYENDLYELNTIMIKTMLEINHIDLSCFDEKNLSIIMGEENQLKKYVLENFNDYFNSCYTLCTSDNDDENSIMEVLNNDDIDLENKKKIVINERFNKYNIKDVNDDLIDVIVQEDKLKITYNNLLEIINRKNIINQDIAVHINKHFEEYSKLNINECIEEYDGETIDLFINQYTLSEEITRENFETLFKTFNKKIEKIEEIDLDRIEYLIKNNLIEFNNENYEYIETNIPEKLIDFIVNNKQSFIEEIEQYDIEPIKNELLINNKISNEDKMVIINHCNIEDLENNTICYLGIQENIYFTDVGININVLQDINIDFDKKLDFLKFLVKETKDSNQVTEYIHLIKNGYEHINTVRNSCTINENYANTELFDLLKQNGYISSFRKGKRKNYILYNKLNRNI